MNSKIISIFEIANSSFLTNDRELILSNVNERSMCTALSQHLTSNISCTKYKKYHVDTEYNRNNGKIKTIIDNILEIISINCDLIVHSRGENIKQDNLIALEMKKSTASKPEKQRDKNRLIALTKDTFDEVWSYDGRTFPKHVCRYCLGIYYEVNIRNKNILLEYFQKGKLLSKKTISF